MSVKMIRMPEEIPAFFLDLVFGIESDLDQNL